MNNTSLHADKRRRSNSDSTRVPYSPSGLILSPKECLHRTKKTKICVRAWSLLPVTKRTELLLVCFAYVRVNVCVVSECDLMSM